MSKYGKSRVKLLQHATLAAASINNTEHWDNCSICYGSQYYRDDDKQIFDIIIVSVYRLQILITCTLTQVIMSEVKIHYQNYHIDKMWSERLITNVPSVILWGTEYLWAVPVRCNGCSGHIECLQNTEFEYTELYRMIQMFSRLC